MHVDQYFTQQLHFTRRFLFILTLSAVSCCSCLCAAAKSDAVKPLSSSKALKLIREYLAEEDPAKKLALLDLAKHTEPKTKILKKALAPSRYSGGKSGISHDLQLQMPAQVSDKAATYSLAVPSSYKPNKLWPLIIGLHGGGNNSGSGKQHMALMTGINNALVVCPTSVDLGIQHYWRSPKNEVMLDLLVRQLSKQFPIDPNRIYLSGYSMGGIGAYYLGTRLSARYAAIAPGGGAWSSIYWQQLLNTPIYIWHGRNDMRGKQFTNYTYAKNAALLLEKTDTPFELRSMDCGHGNVPSSEFKRMCDWLLSKKRNPYPRRIIHASPCAKDFSVPLADSPPDRWLAIDSIGNQKLNVMGSVSQGGDNLKEIQLKMGTLDATWTKDNVLEVTSENVSEFRVLLSEELVDFKKPIHIIVNGNSVFNESVSPSLPFAMQYIDKHRDIAMIYTAEVVIKLNP